MNISWLAWFATAGAANYRCIIAARGPRETGFRREVARTLPNGYEKWPALGLAPQPAPRYAVGESFILVNLSQM